MQYKLKALLLHRGTSTSTGHYQAIVWDDGTWLRCSDDVVSAVSTEEALAPSSDIYMCIYTGSLFFTDYRVAASK